MEVHISTGNTKLGNVHNISLPPERTCAGRLCRELCYANKAWKQYPDTRTAWTDNWNAWKEDAMGYFETISLHIAKHKVERFRWHVGGDIPDKGYFHGMCTVARVHSDVKFLCFTKAFEYLDYGNSYRPDNLRVVLSAWPGLDWVRDVSTSPKQWVKDHVRNYAQAWVDFKEMPPTPPRMEPNAYCDLFKEYKDALNAVRPVAIECAGACDECFMCWYMDPGSVVLFRQH